MKFMTSLCLQHQMTLISKIPQMSSSKNFFYENPVRQLNQNLHMEKELLHKRILDLNSEKVCRISKNWVQSKNEPTFVCANEF